MTRGHGAVVFAATLLAAIGVFWIGVKHPLQAQSEQASPDAGRSLAEELPRIPYTPLDQALSTFHVEHGFSLDLVAGEPDVVDPVDACFDADGRMYVAEMRGYPFSHEPTKLNPQGGGKKEGGVVRMLEDTDGDGRMDRSTRFAEGISWPTSVCCYREGVFVLAPPNLYYFRDDDGDGKADVREIVFSGFGRDNVQSVANNMEWTLDNRIAVAAGRNPGTLKHDGQDVFTLGTRDFSFDPETKQVQPLTGGVQFGHSLDDWGHRFVCSNSNHIQQVIFEARYVDRNPYFQPSGTIRSIAKEGAAAPVFRRSPAEPWRVVRTRRRVADPKFRKSAGQSEQHAVGFFTSATGVTIYRGDAYPEAFRGNAFVGDVGGNLVHRKFVEGEGPVLTAVRADQQTEFVASTDNWFRPVNFVNAPDGTLYILDMYRETIEHPYSIPEDIKAHLHLESGDNRGRIYRLRPPEFMPRGRVRLRDATSRELVEQLASANAWHRETAQRLLTERQDKTVVPQLREAAVHSKLAVGRLHALWTLHAFDALTDAVLLAALGDEHPGIRTHAVRLAEETTSDEVLSRLMGLVDDESEAVRFQLALSLGEFDGEQAVTALADLVRNPNNSNEIRSALMTSVYGRADRLAIHLLEDLEFARTGHARGWLTTLVPIVGAAPDDQAALRLLAAVVELPEQLDMLEWSLVAALQEGLQRRGGSIAVLVAGESAAPELRKGLDDSFASAAKAAHDSDLSELERRTAIGALAAAGAELAIAELSELLTPQTPQKLQTAAVQSLSSQRDPRVASALLAGWKTYSPAVRLEALDALTTNAQRADALLKAIEAGTVLAAELPRDRGQLLANHPNKEVRALAARVLGAGPNPDRVKVVQEYQSALEMPGVVERGRVVFEKKCATCHRVNQVGHQVGPEFTSVQNKSPEDLLIAILDPSRELQPNFISYTAVTLQGTVHTGLISAESSASVTLKRAEGKEDVILRENIEEFVSSGKSLMPDGLEKEVSPQDVADVIAYIKALGTSVP